MKGSYADTDTIFQYWHSSSVPADVRELIATFQSRNAEMRHRLLCESSAEELIAERFTSRELAAFRSCAVPAMQADYFRCCAVFACGGIYADASLECRRPLRQLLDDVAGGLLIRLPGEGVIYNGFLAFATPGHPLLRLALDIATANIERRVANAVNLVTGPWVFTCLDKLHQAGSLTTKWAPNPTVERVADVMLEEIGRYDRVEKAFEGVSVRPAEKLRKWADFPSVLPAYKTSGATRWAEWPKRNGSIFR
jgi:mannosyltransferase OCH1-like enzyme